MAPKGVGYGFVYEETFRKAFQTGTALDVDFIAPTTAGGNLSGFLYITAMNRAQKGVEALVSYYQQNPFAFCVFDWARPGDHWQIDIPFSSLTDYLSTKTRDGMNYQIIGFQNQTFIKNGDIWTNAVWLKNAKNNQYDLIYSYDYPSSEREQKDGWPGSWAPIVETFQTSHSGTHRLGCLNVFLQSRDSNADWNGWELLSPSQSNNQQDDLGFRLAFLDPNFSFSVES